MLQSSSEIVNCGYLLSSEILGLEIALIMTPFVIYYEVKLFVFVCLYRVDNNHLLLLMIHVFRENEEQLFKVKLYLI